VVLFFRHLLLPVAANDTEKQRENSEPEEHSDEAFEHVERTKRVHLLLCVPPLEWRIEGVVVERRLPVVTILLSLVLFLLILLLLLVPLLVFLRFLFPIPVLASLEIEITFLIIRIALFFSSCSFFIHALRSFLELIK